MKSNRVRFFSILLALTLASGPALSQNSLICSDCESDDPTPSGEMQKNYSKETWNNGSMSIFSTPDGLDVKSVFTATNGIVITLESKPNSHTVAIGATTVALTRLINGDIQVNTSKNGQNSDRVFSKSEIQQVQPVTLENAVDINNGGMNSAELFAYSQYVAFLEANDPYVLATIPSDGTQGLRMNRGLKCGLYVLGTGIVGMAAYDACLGSLGFACAGGIVGTLAMWDSTMNVCGW